MVQAKRFETASGFNSWAQKNRIKKEEIVAIVPHGDSVTEVFYDLDVKCPTYYTYTYTPPYTFTSPYTFISPYTLTSPISCTTSALDSTSNTTTTTGNSTLN